MARQGIRYSSLKKGVEPEVAADRGGKRAAKKSCVKRNDFVRSGDFDRGCSRHRTDFLAHGHTVNNGDGGILVIVLACHDLIIGGIVRRCFFPVAIMSKTCLNRPRNGPIRQKKRQDQNPS